MPMGALGGAAADDAFDQPEEELTAGPRFDRMSDRAERAKQEVAANRRPAPMAPPKAPAPVATVPPRMSPPPVTSQPPMAKGYAQPEGGGGGGSVYLTQLAALARELEAQGRGRADAAAIRVLRQRLTEWIEDIRSVGGNDALAAAVEQLVQRLSGALALGGDLARESIEIAAELARYAGGAPPAPAPKKGRAFWK
jgi:hypothetical protein